MIKEQKTKSSGKSKEETTREETVTEGTTPPSPRSPEYELHTFISTVVNTRGTWGTLKRYTVGDFKELADVVEKYLQDYGPMETVAANIHTKFAKMRTVSALKGYSKLEDELKLGSNVL